MIPESARTRFPHAAALLLLSLLWAAGFLRADLLPASVSPPLPAFLAGALPLALLAVCATTIALLRRSPWPNAKQTLSALSIALGMFLAPAWLVHLTQNSVPSLARVALYSLVPLFVAVLEPHLDPEATRSSFDLNASLAAFLGMLLLFGFQTPASLSVAAAQCSLILAASLIAAANCLAVRTARALNKGSFATFTTLVAALASVMLLSSSALAGEPPVHAALFAPADLWTLLVDFPALALLFWLFTRLSALRMATRFLFAPLIATLASALIVAPRISLFSALGLLLLAASAAWLLFAPTHSADIDDHPASIHLHRN